MSLLKAQNFVVLAFGHKQPLMAKKMLPTQTISLHQHFLLLIEHYLQPTHGGNCIINFNGTRPQATYRNSVR
jgi:hypothetical protein